MNRITVALIVAAATAGFAAIVPPAGAQEVPAMTVSYADLDLSRPAGMATIEHRIARAAYRVCGDTGPVVDVATRAREEKCRTAAIASAMTTLRAKTMLAYASR